jgi:GT2 family glycosyltransferase
MSAENPISIGEMREGASARFGGLAKPFLSVVIPTYRRLDLLQRVIAELESQVAQQIEAVEVVVCDDASQDGTVEWLAQQAASNALPLSWTGLTENGGPARARNIAIRRARGEIILLLGDDIVPGPGLLVRHGQWHRAHPEDAAALLGRTTWPADMAVTPFMRHLESGGRALFMNYKDLPVDQPISGLSFYTCNVSFKRALFVCVGGFDEQFPFASHEDLEFGLRLEQAGMRLSYDPEAVGYHWHRLDLPGTVRRVYRMGYSSVLFWQQVGEQGSGLRRALRTALAGMLGLSLVRGSVLALARRANAWPGVWGGLMHGVYWAGVADGRQARTDSRFMDFREVSAKQK